MALASPPPQTLVVFGASGDLTRRKLLPALYDLAYEGLLPEHYAIVGSGGSRLDDAGFRERARAAVEEFSRHRLGEGRLAENARIVLEKPIGHDLASALELGRIVREVFDEPQVFRIDHYLGKEAVQNILVFRFANSMVERAWCGEGVDHVQITVAASAGIERRGRYYEEAGALRDMVQNHLLQVLSFVAMEPPDSLAPEDV